MKQQVVVIHGGDSFRTRQEYLRVLKRWPVTANSFQPRSDWRASLSKTLGRKYEVFLPQMPNKWNARYDEWKIWFERMLPFVRHGVILIGHSLGGLFLAKYLSEKTITNKVKAVVLVSAPHNNTTDVYDFRLIKKLNLLTRQVPKIFLIHSPNDRVVPISELQIYAQALPNATIIVLKNRGHFNQKSFSEIVRLIKKL